MKQQRELAASVLTLSEKAQLEPMGGAFFLHAVDADGQNLRWASVSAAGVLGAEQRAAVPSHVPSLGPWVAVAGKDAPFDRVLIFYGAPSATDPAQTDLMVLSLPFTAGTGGGVGAPTAVASLPVQTSPLRVSVGSGAAGLHAGVAFGLSGVESITFLSVDGAGAKVAGAQTLGSGGTSDFKCLRVTSAFGGSSDMVLGYIRQSSDTDPMPSWRFSLVNASGSLASTSGMGLSAANPGCPAMALPPDGTYALAWNDPAHAWFVDWPPNVSQLFPREVDAAVAHAGGTLPAVAGLGSLGTKFGILYDQPQGPLLRVVDAMGVGKQGDLTLPARASKVGAVASVPLGTSLYATYADYDSGSPLAGRRQWLRLACEP